MSVNTIEKAPTSTSNQPSLQRLGHRVAGCRVELVSQRVQQVFTPKTGHATQPRPQRTAEASEFAMPVSK